MISRVMKMNKVNGKPAELYGSSCTLSFISKKKTSKQTKNPNSLKCLNIAVYKLFLYLLEPLMYMLL